ncbi:transmembrane amino acid transporter domain-containing protein [Trichoderma barbatum]
MGLAPGVVLYTVFGALAGYSGFLLWRLFVQLDSDEHPLRGYSDLALRIYGPWFQHVCNVLQSFQFFLTVMVIMITNGQSISQLSQNKVCFIISVLISALAGCVMGQIRTLKNLGWVGSISVFLNLFVIFATMGVMAHSPPNYVLYAASHPEFDVQDPDPISISVTAPPELTLVDNVNGLMNAVFSFGGATMFVELMAEMRRPMDFWKGLLCADLLIFLCYMVYGIYCYMMQGQYAYINSYQGISPYNWQTVCNAIELLTNVIAAVLYANIGMKVLYNSIGRYFFKIPDLNSRSGKWIWAFLVPIYWMLAWVIALSVPQITSWTVILGAGALLQFTYTFPVFLALGFRAQRDSILPQETYNPMDHRVERVDHGFKRWARGLKKELGWNIFDGVIYVGSLVTCVLGLYAGFKTLVSGYENSPSLVGWRCSSPTG